MTTFVDAPVYTESGRHGKKRAELRDKLERQRAEQNPADSIDEAALAADAERAAAVVKAKADAEGASQAPRERVVVGAKSLVTTEGSMSERDALRLQAMCCAGKAGKVKAFAGQEGVTKVLGEADIDSDAVLVFSGCKKCEYTVDSHCTKIFVESCEDVVLRFNAKVVTQTIEINRAERCNFLIGTKIGTLQVEQSKKVNVVYASKELFNMVVWAGCFLMRLQVGEADLMRCDFGLTQQFDQTINLERTQFKVWYDKLGKLSCDKIVRLKNGFPTTKREDDEFERQQEANMAGLAERMGITISRKQGEKVKPNAPCPCGSGKKFKKCCKC